MCAGMCIIWMRHRCCSIRMFHLEEPAGHSIWIGVYIYIYIYIYAYIYIYIYIYMYTGSSILTNISLPTFAAGGTRYCASVGNWITHCSWLIIHKYHKSSSSSWNHYMFQCIYINTSCALARAQARCSTLWVWVGWLPASLQLGEAFLKSWKVFYIYIKEVASRSHMPIKS